MSPRDKDSRRPANPGYTIRVGTREDLPFLKAMLYEAAYWHTDLPRPPLEEGLSRSDLVDLLAEWGRPGDCSVIYQSEQDARIGAAWYRLWTKERHSYGFIDPRTPEIGIGVVEAFRGRGIGRMLLQELLTQAKKRGIERLSLSVETANRTARLYQRIGFKIVGRVDQSWTMSIATG